MMATLLPLLWANKRIIGEAAGILLLCFVAYWFFWHNPQKIDALEHDKQELSRQVENGKQAIVLLDNINQGKAGISHDTFKQISSIRAAAVPRRAVIIRGGMQLQPVH